MVADENQLGVIEDNLLNSDISWLQILATWCYEANKAKGFYQDEELVNKLNEQALKEDFRAKDILFDAANRIEELHTAVKTCLIADEAFEALREHRRREPEEKYFRELGDVVIRVLSEFGKANVDPLPILMDILRTNLAREFRHGNRRY
jgi:hypothetical protein